MKEKRTEPGWRKVVWAVDPFATDPDLAARTVAAIRAVARNAIVAPVGVLRSHEIDLASPILDNHGANMSSSAARNLEKLLQQVDVPGVVAPRFLGQSGKGVRQAVRELLQFAEDNGADAVAVSTHGRRGLARFFVGSFAESLLHTSPLPTVVCSPRSKPIPGIQHIFFPSDLSDKSREVLEQVIPLAREWEAKIVIFHRVTPMFVATPYPFVVPQVSDQSVKEIESELRQRGKRMAYAVEQEGVEAKFLLSHSTKDTADLINATAAKFSAAVIAMASQTGPISSALLGSVTRRVVRDARLPVIVLHPSPEEQTGEEDLMLGMGRSMPLLG